MVWLPQTVAAGYQIGLTADKFHQFLTQDRLILDNQHARFAYLLPASIRHLGHRRFSANMVCD